MRTSTEANGKRAAAGCFGRGQGSCYAVCNLTQLIKLRRQAQANVQMTLEGMVGQGRRGAPLGEGEDRRRD